MTYDGYRKYDRAVAQSYDSDRENEAHWKLENAYVAGLAAQGALGRVLDVPVGTGRFLDLMAGASEVVGVDVSEEMLTIAKARAATLAAPPTLILKGDALKLPFDDASFDTVVCFRLAHLLPPELVAPLLVELARVCRGRLIVQFYVTDATLAPKRAPLLERIIARAKRALAPDPGAQRPWSHIQSYPHTRPFIDACLRSTSMKVVRWHPLDQYGPSSVEVVELQR